MVPGRPGRAGAAIELGAALEGQLLPGAAVGVTGDQVELEGEVLGQRGAQGNDELGGAAAPQHRDPVDQDHFHGAADVLEPAGEVADGHPGEVGGIEHLATRLEAATGDDRLSLSDDGLKQRPSGQQRP